MTDHDGMIVTLPADVNQVDETGYIWAFLSEADEPDLVWPGAIVVAGDAVEPFLAQVVDIVDGPNGASIVHLLVVGPLQPFRLELRRRAFADLRASALK